MRALPDNLRREVAKNLPLKIYAAILTESEAENLARNIRMNQERSDPRNRAA